MVTPSGYINSQKVIKTVRQNIKHSQCRKKLSRNQYTVLLKTHWKPDDLWLSCTLFLTKFPQTPVVFFSLVYLAFTWILLCWCAALNNVWHFVPSPHHLVDRERHGLTFPFDFHTLYCTRVCVTKLNFILKCHTPCYLRSPADVLCPRCVPTGPW